LTVALREVVVGIAADGADVVVEAGIVVQEVVDDGVGAGIDLDLAQEGTCGNEAGVGRSQRGERS
jgi:hypothetical protein